MLIILAALVFGLLIGSFLNACIHRLPRDLSLVSPSRSFCPNCEQTIAWYDNLPVLSYAVLGGKCRHCREPISWRYPLVEALTGIAFALIAARVGVTWEGAKLCTYVAFLIALIFTDLEERILPDEFTLGGTLLGIFFAWFVLLKFPLMQILLYGRSPQIISVAEAAVAAALTSGMLWGGGELYYRIRHKEGLGLGDVKFVAMIAAFRDLPGVLFTIMIGSIMGVVVGATYIAVTRRDIGTYELPFGSFLGVAAILEVLVGEPAFQWWSGLG